MMYTCGNTPDDFAHIGHGATTVTYDVLRRNLHSQGFDTVQVRNVTDVDDDILRRAQLEGVFYRDMAEVCTGAFQRALNDMGLLPPRHEPRATAHIDDIIDCVTRLVRGGYGYVVDGTVFFEVATSPRFGQLSHFDYIQMAAIARQRGGCPDDDRKRNPLDFVLWQERATSGEPAWYSPWGLGRPGWHIECTAMAFAHLGPTVDLHGGGGDLVFPHHECSAAQSEALTGKALARHWMHVSMVRSAGEKMSKSLGNVVYLNDLLLEGWEPAAVRLALMSHHYRAGWEWTETLLETASDRLERWRAAGTDNAGYRDVRAALDDDLDIPSALTILDAQAATGKGVSVTAELLLGISLRTPVQRWTSLRKVAA